MRRLGPLHWLVAALSVGLIAFAIWRLEGARAGLEISDIAMGDTHATLYRLPAENRRLVVVSHGFAGSRQLMEAYSLTLARAGFAVVAFDYAGHGRNRVPMSGDVDSIEGTTRQLIAQTREVIDAGLDLPGVVGPVAILGHSMATDVIVRTALEEPRIRDVIAVSLFSRAITPTEPRRLLAINGAWEPQLRAASVEALKMVDPTAEEGETATADGTQRRVVAAPRVEHVGVLYSRVALTEARDWLDGEDTSVAATGVPILALLAALVALAWPLSRLFPRSEEPAQSLPARKFAIALTVPALVAPLIATRIDLEVLPVLVADYLVVHLALMGAGQLALARAYGASLSPVRALPLVALIVWGVIVFGGALDRYVASFWPTGERWLIIALLALGAVPAMLADAVLTEAGRASLVRRLSAKVVFFASLALAVALDFERLLFLIFIVPIIVLFFVVFGTLGRWIGGRSTNATVGVGLGLILAWSLGVTFPLFVT